VDVILCAANNERLESVLASNATNERPQIGLRGRGNQVTALFRGKNAMDEFGNVGVRHGESPE
jgi:hypothetical protein